MTPANIKVMLHCFTIPGPYKDDIDEIAIAQLKRVGMIEYNEHTKSYVCTDKGKTYIGLLMEVPLPVQVWTVADTDEILNTPNPERKDV